MNKLILDETQQIWKEIAQNKKPGALKLEFDLYRKLLNIFQVGPYLKPGEDHFVASFTPQAEGRYMLSIVQPVEETFDGHKYQFNSTAVVQVGDSEAGSTVGQSEFRVLPQVSGVLEASQEVEIQVLLDGQAVEKLEVSVFSPGGWSKTFYTDKDGLIRFTPDRKGRYLVEALHSQEVSGEAYKHLHRVATWTTTLN